MIVAISIMARRQGASYDVWLNIKKGKDIGDYQLTWFKHVQDKNTP